MRTLLTAALAAAALIAPALAEGHDRTCTQADPGQRASCRHERSRAEVHWQGWTRHGGYAAVTRLATGPWGPHSWRSTFRYRIDSATAAPRSYCGSLIVSAHTGRTAVSGGRQRFREHRC